MAAADAVAVSVFIDSQVSEAVLEALPHLEIVASRSTGVDHIDLAACERRGIQVCNVPRYAEYTVAEHVFALLLTISHRVEEALARTRRGSFSSRGLTGFDLRGKTLGVVGAGDIGRATIGIAKGFGMQVLAHDLEPDPALARALGFTYTALPDLLARADIVSLHVPSTPATRHMIGPEQFARMKTGVVLINTARGDLIDIRALVRALVDGKVAAAGLDVLPDEPVIREELELLRSIYATEHDLATLLADQLLIRMPNVIVTPHSAFNTREAVQRILETTVENLRAFAKGRPQNLITGRG